MELRDYQTKAVKSVWDYLNDNIGNPVVWAPVGAGKSILMAEGMRQFSRFRHNGRVIMATTSSELVEQNLEKFKLLLPEADMGMYSASKNRKESAQFLFGSVQSLCRNEYLETADLIMVDECHTISNKEGSQWDKFFKIVKNNNKDARVVGYTGTPWRLNDGKIYGKNKFFENICYKIEMRHLLDQGYLCEVVSPPPSIKADLSNVNKTAGDFGGEGLFKSIEEVTKRAVDDFCKRGENRSTWMIFAPSVRNAQYIQECVSKKGISCAIVTDKTTASERMRIIDDLRHFRLRSVVSVGTMTTGIDIPCVDMIVALRPTVSSSLVIQMIGRGMRLYPGKENCLLLDYAHWLEFHGPVDLIQPPEEKSKGSGEAPTKNCPNCQTLIPVQFKQCPVCKNEMPSKEKMYGDYVLSELSALSNSKNYVSNRLEVERAEYSEMKMSDKTSALRIKFFLKGIEKPAIRILYFESKGVAKFGAIAAWKSMTKKNIEKNKKNVGKPLIKTSKTPNSVTEAMKQLDLIALPDYLQVSDQGSHFKIIRIIYND